MLFFDTICVTECISYGFNIVALSTRLRDKVCIRLKKEKQTKKEKSLEWLSNSDDASFNVVMGNAITQMQARSKGHTARCKIFILHFRKLTFIVGFPASSFLEIIKLL